jgi:asparagine synthase (glutamine-hydrolysing)
MCGISGIVGDGPAAAPELRAAAQAMADALAHRGPDGDGIWVDEAAGVAFGHRRLAIIDLSAAARQPMISGSGRFVVTFNGEIYNYRALRGELEKAGVRFLTQSDTEVLLEACERWGVEAAAKRLNGIFALALWDRRERVLHLMRDPLGVKPLYWTQERGRLTFGSELKALAAHPAWRRAIDRDALAAYFRHSAIPAPHTIYQNVFKLAPGTILTLAPGGAPRLTRYWDAREVAKAGIADRLDLSDIQAADQLEALLRDAVERQMVSDVPLGAFLSGGIDSSAVVALMQAVSPRPIRSFTIGFREADYDEAEHAAAVARHLGTDHTALYISPAEARNVIPRLSQWFDEPFADSSAIPTFLVAEMARRQVTVALSGDGGDEVFAGYNRYRMARRLARAMRWPRVLRGVAASLLRAPSPAGWDRLLAALPAKRRPAQAGDKLQKLGDVLALADEGAVYRRLVSSWDAPERLVAGGREPQSAIWDAALPRDFADPVERMQYLDTIGYLPDDILTKVDRASMAVGLEARVPLLDPEVIAFAWRLPGALKLRDGQGKWLLRQVLDRHVPRALVERPKMGFGVPIDQWLRGPLRDWAEDLLDERRLGAEGILDAGVVRSAWSRHLSGTRNEQHALWTVLMFQEWKRRWIDGGATRPVRRADERVPAPLPLAGKGGAGAAGAG